MKKIISSLLGGLLLLAVSGISADLANAGQGQGKKMSHGKVHDAGHKHGKSVDKHAMKNMKKSMQFNDSDRAKISTFGKNNPGLANALPPGIAKNLQRGKALPAGIQKVYLPDGALANLKQYPGYDYRVVGNNVVLVNSRDNVVADILYNILR